MTIHIQISGGAQSLFSETLKFDKWISLHLCHSSHEVSYHRHIDRLSNSFSSWERRQLKERNMKKTHQNYAIFCHFWRESTDHLWTPFTKDQWCGNWFKAMTPSCYTFYKIHIIYKRIQHAYSLFHSIPKYKNDISNTFGDAACVVFNELCIFNTAWDRFTKLIT